MSQGILKELSRCFGDEESSDEEELDQSPVTGSRSTKDSTPSLHTQQMSKRTRHVQAKNNRRSDSAKSVPVISIVLAAISTWLLVVTALLMQNAVDVTEEVFEFDSKWKTVVFHWCIVVFTAILGLSAMHFSRTCGRVHQRDKHATI